ncbi:hypothetical protein PM082_001275 [Marasmius tenuissimus]|nr:hypothetical protein PM082_001275 [Marasmius tenuissimus]
MSNYTGRASSITLRIGEKLVYISPPASLTEAVQLAIHEFPEELEDISSRRITFNLNAKHKGVEKSVRISESAWSDSMSRMVRGEILNVVVLPELKRRHSLDGPPQYLEVPDCGGSYPASKSAPTSRAPSPIPTKTNSRSRLRSWFCGRD